MCRSITTHVHSQRVAAYTLPPKVGSLLNSLWKMTKELTLKERSVYRVAESLLGLVVQENGKKKISMTAEKHLRKMTKELTSKKRGAYRVAESLLGLVVQEDGKKKSNHLDCRKALAENE